MNKIFVEAKKLRNINGEVWLWRSETMDGIRHFLTMEDVQKYINLHHRFCRENGRQEEAYSIGTEADFMAAAQRFERKKKANEVKEYHKHVDALIECKRREIKAMDGLIKVCLKFDGKVLNKRFNNAVKDVTGFDVSFNSYSLDFQIFNPSSEYRPHVSIIADWSHGRNRIVGKNDQNPTAWQWSTGERLEAEKAVAVIEYWKNGLLQIIRQMEETKKQYAAYLKTARKAEHIFKEMEGYDYIIRSYAKDHALSQKKGLSKFWKVY